MRRRLVLLPAIGSHREPPGRNGDEFGDHGVNLTTEPGSDGVWFGRDVIVTLSPGRSRAFPGNLRIPPPLPSSPTRRTPSAAPFRRRAAGEGRARRLTRKIRRTRTPTCRRSRRSSRCRRQEEAKRLWLPAGYRMEPVLSEPAHRGSRADRVRRQRPHVRRRAARLFPDAGRHRSDPADRANLDARGSRQRRHVRTSFSVRRQARLPAVRACRSAPTPS